MGRSRIGLTLQEICCSSQVLKPWRSDQEISEKELFIKTQQKSQQNPFYRDLMLKLNRNLTQAVSIETYEIRNSRSDFRPMLVYLYKVSFLTTLDIYKDYFKDRCICRKWPNSLFSLKKLLRLCAIGFCNQGVSWSSSMMNWRTLQPTSSSNYYWC